MGMDVFGKNPTSENGEYFRNNVWWWRPLADYVQEVAPDITSGCKYWHSNDGDGLDADGSRALAKALQERIDNGECEAFAKEYAAELAAMPDVKCELCNGTGIRDDEIGRELGHPDKVIEGDVICDIKERGPHPREGKKGWCNSCNGRGTKRDWATGYPFSVENVQEFVNFLNDCGGFEID